ncbi:DUF4394 domain-containing protein [Nevskia sp.]|uniref:DUF4394 domain-containing protein n=1 Tax=Nevskia sp. TaxID=1929292 RepID=UPI0025F245CF|nr:DUF4394 domain-containing protein [Nevskia sp.]
MFKKTLLAAVVTSAAALSFAPAAMAQSSTANLRVFGITADNTLISFTTAAPRLTSRVVGTITGTLAADSEIVGIDFRVQDGGLYAVGRGGGVYLISTEDATATFVNQLNVGGVALALDGGRFGVDFNPAADRLRIVSDTGQNLRHNVNVGGVTIVDGLLNNGAVPPVTVTGVASAAYTNNDNAVASTGTVLFDLNAAGNLLVQIPPNSGGTSLVGALGVTDIVGRIGFDIYTVTDRDGATVSNRGYASLSNAAGASQLYAVDLSSGVATALGQMRTAAPVVDIALPIAQ